MTNKKSEENLFLDMMKDTPVFILDGRIFYGRENENSFIVKEGPKLEVIERIFRSSNKEIKEYLNGIFKVQNKGSVLENFVLNQVIPYLDNSIDLEGILGKGKLKEEKEETSMEVSEREIKEARGLVEEKLKIPNFDFNNFAVYNNNVYEINEAKKGAVSIAGKHYALNKALSLEEFKKIYQKKLIASQVEAILPEYVLKNKINLDKNKKPTSKEYGYRKKADGTISVWVKVKDYVLKSPSNKEYYLFSGHRLAIDIGWRNHAFLSEQPHPLESVSGPFYGGGLCMGSYSFSFLEREPSGRNFAKVLLDARNVVYRGYTPGCAPMHRLEDFHSHIISNERIAREKLDVTNVNRNHSNRGE